MSSHDAVFLDTGGWLALLNADDHLHLTAVEILRDLGATRRPIITTEWIVAETGNGLARKQARRTFRQAIEAFRNSPNSRLISIDEILFGRALEMYDSVHDKTWGLVDCASFIFMRDEQMIEALTPDRHFEQAGFICLLPTA